MRIIATALQNIKFKQNDTIVNIIRGDKFSLFGNVFAYRNILIDIDKYANMFNIVYDYFERPAFMKVRTKFDIRLTNSSGNFVIIPANTELTLYNNITIVQGCVFNVQTWSNAIDILP